MAGTPYLPLYTGEWMKDEKLSFCEAATRGIFADWLCHMHNGQVDRLTGTARQLGRLGRCDESEALAALRDLQISRAADVSEREGAWTVLSRRRQRELKISAQRREAGNKSATNRSTKQQQNADIDNEDESKKQGSKGRAANLEQVVTFCRELGLPRGDAEWFWHKNEENGWTKEGGKVAILDWHATLRSWKAAGYVPSIKNPRKGAMPPPVEKKISRELPERFRSWLIEKYPERREQIGGWKTFADLPAGVNFYEEWKRDAS